MIKNVMSSLTSLSPTSPGSRTECCCLYRCTGPVRQQRKETDRRQLFRILPVITSKTKSLFSLLDTFLLSPF